MPAGLRIGVKAVNRPRRTKRVDQISGCGAPFDISVDGDQVFPERVHHGFTPGVQAELVKDVADVILDRVLRDEQLLADFAAGHALSHELQHLNLAPGQRRPPTGDDIAVSEQLAHVGEQLRCHHR